MSWNTNQKGFLRMSVTKRADGRLDVAYLKDATTAATATADTLDEAFAWLETTHGTGRGRQSDLFDARADEPLEDLI